MTLNADNVRSVLLALDEELATKHSVGSLATERIRLIVAGGAGGLLAGVLPASRVTVDCDVPWNADDPGSRSAQERLRSAAGAVAGRLGLSPEWLSFQCAMYAWKWPVGWEGRCEAVEGQFNALGVFRLSRLDFIAAKVMGAARRPQDRQDLMDMRPTAAELDAVDEHLDRVEAEHPGREGVEDERKVVRNLRTLL